MIDLNYRPKISWRAAAIPKKDGSLRYLLIPSDELKKAQRDILDELYRNKNLKVHWCATGFVPYRNTMTGALKHDRNTPLIVQLDVHNFFPTFPVNLVMHNLKAAGLSQSKLDYIEDYAVFHGKKGDQLPQGAPTSPYLTNIGMYEVDGIIQGYAKKLGYNYSRYADDLAFSVIPGEEQGDAIEARKQLMMTVATMLKDKLDLEISWKKTLCSFSNSPRVPRRIVGVTIRKDGFGYNAPRKLRQRARAALHNLYKALQKNEPIEDYWPQYWEAMGLINYCNYLRSKSDMIVSTFDPFINKDEYEFVRKKFNYASRSYREQQ